MTTFRVVKISFAFIVFCVFAYNRIKKEKQKRLEEKFKREFDFYSIYDGNQTELIYAPQYDSEWLEALDKKYSWENFDSYDNRFWEYMYRLFDTLTEMSGKDESEEEFFNKLNKPQKVFHSLLAFTGDVDNGGVNQFFFNKPEFAFSVLEAFDELKLNKLKNDYEKCLNEFIGASDSYLKRKEVFNDISINWDQRWDAFKSGENEIKSADILEDYFYTDEFKKELYKTFVDYADKNISLFMRK
ncbi:DMP19 family protein [Flavobacterium beibuense]|uniref:DMP19 family protein n=1 Tax=Flavobacterium beibuense TaxID=657326 RepID=UPI003A8DE898